MLSQRLQAHGINVETASSGEEALIKVKNKNFDAVILDLIMPGIGGIDTLKYIKEQNPELQVIMLTGRATVGKTVEAMKEGALDFLEKPADINKLIDKIKEARNKKILLVVKDIGEKIKGGVRRL